MTLRPREPWAAGLPPLPLTAAEPEARRSELENVIALDLETTGLDEQAEDVLELYCRFGSICAGEFTPCATESEKQFVFPTMSNVETWNDIVLKMHSANGLLAECIAMRRTLLSGDERRDGLSRTKGYFHDVDMTLAKRADYLLPPKQKWTLLGNSVHFDLRFLRRLFPEFSKRLSHRVIDCSAIRLFCEALGRPYEKGAEAHRAKADVEESIRLFNDCHDWCRAQVAQ